MSVQFQRNPQQVIIEPNLDDGQQHLQGPGRVSLERSVSHQERSERLRIRRIFDKYDTNRDGFLAKRELKQLIHDHPAQCTDIPKGIAKAMLNIHDMNNDGQLDFEEFFQLSQQHQWVVRDFAVRYCKYLVPSRDGAHADETVSGYSTTSAHDTIDGAYESQMTFFPPPLTMVIFSILEVIFFVVDIVQSKDYRDGDINSIGTSVNGPAATLFIYNPRKRDEAWRFVTYMFVHVGVMHILMNLIVQLFLGVALELVHHWWRVALVYIAGVAAGSMGTSIANPRIYLAGASGGVYALITAHIATILMNWHEMEYAIIQLLVFVIFCGTDVGFSIYRHINDPYDRVGYMAHLCGGIAGLLVGIGVLRNLHVRSYEKKLWWVAVTLYVSLMIAGCCFHIFYPDYFLSNPTSTPTKGNFQ